MAVRHVRRIIAHGAIQYTTQNIKNIRYIMYRIYIMYIMYTGRRFLGGGRDIEGRSAARVRHHRHRRRHRQHHRIRRKRLPCALDGGAHVRVQHGPSSICTLYLTTSMLYYHVYVISLLYDHIVILLSCYRIIILSYYLIILLFYYLIFLLFYYLIIL